MNIEHLKPYFHVIAVVSNPVRYQSRYRLFKEFEQHMKESGANLTIVEVQNGLRSFTVTDHSNQDHVQLRTEDELWIKENMINLGIQHISRKYPSWKYVAWVDADIQFVRKDWVEETIQRLQTCHWVQMFQTAIDMGPTGEALHIHQGFVWSWWQGHVYKPGYVNWHPGYCWAATREAITGVGGLLDRAILGSADRHMAMSLIGRGSESYNHGVHSNYKHMVKTWENRAKCYVKQDIGYVPGTILHAFHGSKRNRLYQERWKILVDNQYDPYVDVYPDPQGVLRLEDDKIELRDAIKRYFQSRNEDSPEI
jgi:hypothetical protein